MSGKAILRLEKVDRQFVSNGRKVMAANGVSLELARGETLGVVGESGSGKSTVGRIAVGLDHPTTGRVLIDGVDVSKLSSAERRVHFRRCQMVFQDPYSSLNPRLTVGRQIAESLIANDIRDRREIRDRIEELFAKVRLTREQIDRYPHEFSGGQRQRIAIARALAPSPSVVVADEPVSALDVSIQAQVLDLFDELQATDQVSYLFISHDIAVVSRLSHRVAVMYRGRIVEFGPAASVIRNPQHAYTRSLLDAVPRIGRRRQGDRTRPPALPEHSSEDRFTMVSEEHGVLVASGV